jgi:hypothetical protein
MAVILIGLVIGAIKFFGGSTNDEMVEDTPLVQESAVPAVASTENSIITPRPDPDAPADPVISLRSGTYDKALTIWITAEEGSVHYTLDGSDPTEDSPVYNGIDPIEIKENGTFTLKVVLINDDGLSSGIVTETYELKMPVPEEPTVLEDSGNYDTETQIVVVVEEGVTVHYSTDGKDPTASSPVYTTPLAMPYGDSQFRFIAIDNTTGLTSEVAVRKYSRHDSVQYSDVQAVSALIEQLVIKGYLLDGNGRVAGQDGYNLYLINGTQTISGGDYYVITENHVAADNTQTPTGLLFAVTVHNGSVYRLGTDTSGSYFLKQFS